MLRNTTCRGISRHVTDVTCATCQGLYFVHLKNDFSTVQGCYISLHHKDYITTCHGRQSDTCQGSYCVHLKNDFSTVQGCYISLHHKDYITTCHGRQSDTCQGSYCVH